MGLRCKFCFKSEDDERFLRPIDEYAKNYYLELMDRPFVGEGFLCAVCYVSFDPLQLPMMMKFWTFRTCWNPPLSSVS